MKTNLLLVLAFLFALVGILACGDSSTTSPSPITPPPIVTPPTPAVPELISSSVQINRSSGSYHYIGWKFTIKSPRAYGYAYVEIRWYDANDFQIDWSNWVGALKQGTHTYSDEAMVKKDVWARVVRREVELSTSYHQIDGRQMGRP